MRIVACLALLAPAALGVRLEEMGLSNSTEEKGHCRMDCLQRPGWRRGHWILELPTNATELPAFSPRRIYYVHADSECIAKNRVSVGEEEWSKADVIPFIDEDNPIKESELHVYVNPMLLVTLRQQQSSLLGSLKLCDYPPATNDKLDGEARGTCLCNLIPPGGRASLVSHLPVFPSSVLSRLDKLESDCGVAMPLLVEYFVMTLLIGIGLIAGHTIYCLRHLPQRSQPQAIQDEEEPSDPSEDEATAEAAGEEGETAEDDADKAAVDNDNESVAGGPSVVIKSPLSCFRECCSKQIGVVLIIVSLQTLLVHYIIWIMEWWLMYIIIALIFLFSVISVTRMMYATAQDQLVHAAFAAGFALTKKPPEPSSVPWLNMATVIFILMLVGLALGADVSSWLTGGKALFTALMALAGPIWRVCKEHLSTSYLEKDIAKTHVTFSVRGLAALMDERSSPEAVRRTSSTSGTAAAAATSGTADAAVSSGTTVAAARPSCRDARMTRRSRLEKALCSGQLPFVPFAVLIGAGRKDKSIREACRLSSLSSPALDSSEDVSYQLYDMRWLGRSVYELTGSRWGFSLIPVLCGVLCILSLASLMQVVSYTCLVPELEMLSLQAADTRIKFQPWRYKYIVEIDQSFRAVGLAMSYNKGYITNVNFSTTDHNGSREVWHPQDMKSIRLDGSFPHIAEVHVTNVRGKTWTYSLRFLPTRTLADSVYITAGDSKRCMSLTRMEGAVLSIPEEAKNVSVCVKLREYTITVPVLECESENTHRAQQADGSRQSSVLTTFCPKADERADGKRRSNGLRQKACKERCRTRGDCLDAFPGKKKGCFFAVTTKKMCDEESVKHRCLPSKAAEAIALRHDYGSKDTPVGRLCESSDLDALSCPSASVDREKAEVSFPAFNLTPYEDQKRVDLTFTLALSPNQQQLDSIVEQLSFSQQAPEPTMVLSQIKAYKENKNVTVKHKVRVNTMHWNTTARSITVTLQRYKPQHIDTMFLGLAPLLPDPDAKVDWQNVQDYVCSEIDGCNTMLDFSSCSENKLIGNRYAVCKKNDESVEHVRWGGWDEVLYLGLDPWSPSVTGLEGYVKSPHMPPERRRKLQVELKLEGAMSPAKWALQEELKKTQQNASARCQLRWPGVHLQTLFADTETLCTLAENGCDVAFQGGHVPDTLQQNTTSAQLLSVALLDGIAAALPSLYVPLLSCTWARSRSSAARVGGVALIDRENLKVEMDFKETKVTEVEILPLDSILMYTAETQDNDMLHGLCYKTPWVSTSFLTMDEKKKDHVKVLGKILHAFVNAQPSDEIVRTLVQCVAEHNLDEDPLRELSTYLLQSAMFPKFFEEVQYRTDGKWTQAMVAKVVEGRCEKCMEWFDDRKSLLTRLHLRLAKHGEMQVLTFLEKFILDQEAQRGTKVLQELELVLDWKLWDKEVRQTTSDQFGRTLKKALPLRNLTIGWPSKEHVKRWLTAQENVKGLEKLVIQGQTDPLKKKEDVERLSRTILLQHETLESLELDGVFCSGSFDIFASSIQSHERAILPKLKVLNLTSNCIGYDGRTQLAKLFDQLPKLTHINLATNMLTDKGLRSLADALRPIAAQLQEVNLWGQRGTVNESSLEYLVLDALKEARNLRSFHFSAVGSVEDALDAEELRWLNGPEHQMTSTLYILKKAIDNWPEIENVPVACGVKENGNLVKDRNMTCNDYFGPGFGY